MSKTDVKQAWTNVADELSALGLKLKYHVEQERTADEGDEMKAALGRLAEAFDDTVDAAGNAAKDPAVKDDVRTAGQLLVEALTTTVDEAVSGIREAVSKSP